VNFGEAVRGARLRQGWTQAQLGERSGFKRQAMSLLEKSGGRVSTLAAVEVQLGLQFDGIAPGASWAERVRSTRVSSGLSPSEMAQRARVATNTVRALEQGTGSVECLSRVISVIAPAARVKLAGRRLSNINIGGKLGRLRRTETFRTPRYSFAPLFDYQPEWFEGRGCDPSAGDGRMLAEIAARGNDGPHWANDIREEERELMREALPPSAIVTVGDYLAMTTPPQADFMVTNAPFTLSMDFVQKARTHVSGPICILQSVAWQGTQKRSALLREAGLAYVLNLPRRPKWEVDVGTALASIWDYAWFVFLPDHRELPQMDWLRDAEPSTRIGDQFMCEEAV
jgi:transcriptional regulator with XRE-family HTH domain